MSKQDRRSGAPRRAEHRRDSSRSQASQSHRQERLEHLLHAELQSLLRDEASDPALQGVVVLHVHLSPDGGHARVAYASADPQAAAALARATGFLRARLASLLDLKRLPRLGFTSVGAP